MVLNVRDGTESKYTSIVFLSIFENILVVSPNQIETTHLNLFLEDQSDLGLHCLLMYNTTFDTSVRTGSKCFAQL